MERQHSAPILFGADDQPRKLTRDLRDARRLEARLQEIIHDHPHSLPIEEIDPHFAGAIPICRELQLGSAGRVDNFLLTRNALPILVECKLWRNPEARRKVIGQILDYARVLSRWTVSDLQREVSRRVSGGRDLTELMRSHDPEFDEQHFNDSLSSNLRRGRFLLLIVGDGIRQDVESITEYLQAHAGLHFTFGLVELAIFEVEGGGFLVAPRVLARTSTIVRNVIAIPEGNVVQEQGQIETADDGPDPERSKLGSEQEAFWKEFLPYLKLDDPAQEIPSAPRLGHLSLMMPSPQGSSWLTVYRDMSAGEVGVFLSASRNSPGEDAMRSVVDEWETVAKELGKNARLTKDKYDRPRMIEALKVGNLNDPSIRRTAFPWLADCTNRFVNAMRPRIRQYIVERPAAER